MPLRDRVVALAASAVLGAGVLSAMSYEPPPPQAAPPPPRVTGVSATASAVQGAPARSEFVYGFSLLVTVEGLRGRGDSGSPAEQDDLALLALTGRGFALQLVGAALPVALPQAREQTIVAYDVEAAVIDCAIEALAPRRLELQLERGSDVRSPLVVDVDPAVVRGLDRLVSTTCNRPRG